MTFQKQFYIMKHTHTQHTHKFWVQALQLTCCVSFSRSRSLSEPQSPSLLSESVVLYHLYSSFLCWYFGILELSIEWIGHLMNIYGMSVQTRKKRNIFLLLTQFFFAQSGKTDVDKTHPTPCACYLSTSISWWTSNEHSLSATHQLLHPYIIPKKYGLFPCYMWINGGPGRRLGWCCTTGLWSHDVNQSWEYLWDRKRLPLFSPCPVSGPYSWASMQKRQHVEKSLWDWMLCQHVYTDWLPSPQGGEASSVCDIGKPQQGNPWNYKSKLNQGFWLRI